MTNKAKDLCSGIKILQDENVSLAEDLFFMAAKLKEARKALAKEDLVIPYDNGGGQSGIRENPAFLAYEHLLNTYNKALRQLTEAIDNGAPTKKASGILKELKVIAGKRVG